MKLFNPVLLLVLLCLIACVASISLDARDPLAEMKRKNEENRKRITGMGKTGRKGTKKPLDDFHKQEGAVCAKRYVESCETTEKGFCISAYSMTVSDSGVHSYHNCNPFGGSKCSTHEGKCHLSLCEDDKRFAEKTKVDSCKNIYDKEVCTKHYEYNANNFKVNFLCVWDKKASGCVSSQHTPIAKWCHAFAPHVKK